MRWPFANRNQAAFAVMLSSSMVVNALLLASCYRGAPSEKPPVHLVKDMDNQQKYKPQAESQFFADGATMRTPPPGTVARGQLHDDDAYYRGLDANNGPLPRIPVPITEKLLLRGRERFEIFCAVCHGRVGDGHGIMAVAYSYPPPPTFHSDSLRAVADGYLFDVISNGIRNMPAYRFQIPVDDRWAVVAYLRALQRSQHARLSDLPHSPNPEKQRAGQ